MKELRPGEAASVTEGGSLPGSPGSAPTTCVRSPDLFPEQENLRGPAPSGPARSGAVPWGLASSANTSGPPWGGEESGQNPRARVICRAAPRPLPAHLGPAHHQRWLPQVALSGPPGVSRDRGPMVFCGNPCGPKGKGDSELRDRVGKGCRRKKGNPGGTVGSGERPFLRLPVDGGLPVGEGAGRGQQGGLHWKGPQSSWTGDSSGAV